MKLQFAVVVLAAGFGKDLNAAHADTVVLCGERVLIDADFADRSFGRQTSAGETIDVDLPAIRSAAKVANPRPNRLVVGEDIQFLTAENQGREALPKGPFHLQESCLVTLPSRKPARAEIETWFT
jgi:hypothetical protein